LKKAGKLDQFEKDVQNQKKGKDSAKKQKK
jgi:hypothetical protein